MGMAMFSFFFLLLPPKGATQLNDKQFGSPKKDEISDQF